MAFSSSSEIALLSSLLRIVSRSYFEERFSKIYLGTLLIRNSAYNFNHLEKTEQSSTKGFLVVKCENEPRVCRK